MAEEGLEEWVRMIIERGEREFGFFLEVSRSFSSVLSDDEE